MSAFNSATQKNNNLIKDLSDARSNFATIGTNKAKRRLNKLSEINPTAKAYRLALEIEDQNILAKKVFGTYRNSAYAKKSGLINDLADVCHREGWVFGIQKSDVRDTTHIIYFHLPNCEQISWHFSPVGRAFYTYPGEWDGKVNSTLKKLDVCVFDFLKNNGMV